MKSYVERKKCDIQTRYVGTVSWPRSGHHLLVRLCFLYFNGELGYCEFYDTNAPCCHKFPCVKGGNQITLTKNHDFEFDVPILPNVPMIIQWRDFAPSVVSDFELYVNNGGEDSADGFKRMSSCQAHKYNRFLKKWVHCELPCDNLAVKYEDLVDDPLRWLGCVIEFIANAHQLDLDKIRDVVNNVHAETVVEKKTRISSRFGVHKSRDCRDFRFYDESWFREIEAVAGET